MREPVTTLEGNNLTIIQEIRVKASIATTFAALLEQIGPSNETPNGNPMPFVIEAFPGGRWYRDLGDHNGHFWGSIQAIKSPTLLEFSGPLFMSFPVSNNVQYRLTEEAGETIIRFTHRGFGLFPDNFPANLAEGWAFMLNQTKTFAESQAV